MSLTESQSMNVGTSAPRFTLPDTRNNAPVSTSDYDDKPLLIVFMCNHCPYVVHLVDALVEVAHDLAKQGTATVCISSNDTQRYPQDGPEKMAQLAMNKGFDFPYCLDESQDVARAYGAVCTPDIFLFDRSHQLYYHGQFDDTRPGQTIAAHGGDLIQAALAMQADHPPPTNVLPSVGCSIKWKT